MRKLVLLFAFLLPFIVQGQTTKLPVLQLGTITDTVASVSRVLSNPTLYVIDSDGKLSKEYTISIFDLVILDEAGEQVMPRQTISGNRLPKVQLERIKQLNRGAQLHFSRVRASYKGSRLLQFPDMIIYIE